VCFGKPLEAGCSLLFVFAAARPHYQLSQSLLLSTEPASLLP
jgi:hypothetical protein